MDYGAKHNRISVIVALLRLLCNVRSVNSAGCQADGRTAASGQPLNGGLAGAVRQAIPDASSKPPGAVLEHVLEALRQADSKLIDCPEST